MLFLVVVSLTLRIGKKPHRLLTFLSSAREQKIMVKEMERARLAAFGWCALELWGNCGASLLALSAVPPSESLPSRIKNDYFFNSLIERNSYVQGFALDAGDESHSQFNRMIKSSARNSARRRMKEKLDWLFMDLRRFVSCITISCLFSGSLQAYARLWKRQENRSIRISTKTKRKGSAKNSIYDVQF